MTSSRATGLAVLRAYVNLREVPPSPASVVFDATWRAGRAMDLALRIRRHGRLSYRAVETFAGLVSLPASDLRLWALPVLRNVGLLDYAVGPDGTVTEVEEQVGVAAGVLDQCAAVWQALAPQSLEACAIASTDHATYAPLTLSDHQAILEAEGFPGDLHEPAFVAMAAVGLLRRQYAPALGEDVIWAPYVWGTEAIDIAAFLSRLPTNERQALAALSRQASEHPGVSVADLRADTAMVRAARHAGLLDATRVLSGGVERGFAFPPGLEHRIAGGLTDATHERKLFVAHILNGYRYGHPSTGRIVQPLALVRALVTKGCVGPTTAARRDYGLLEAAGIVHAEPLEGGRAMLHLVKEDVARDSLDLLSLALDDEGGTTTASSVDALWLPGSHLGSPEKDRAQLPAPAGHQAEIINSAVLDLRKEIGRTLRGETVT